MAVGVVRVKRWEGRGMTARPTRNSAADRRGEVVEQDESTDSKRQPRLSVNISKATEDALLELSSDKGITITEALRRLVGYGSIMYRAISKESGEVLIRKNGEIERVMLVE